MGNLDYFAPTDVGEALKFLAEHGEKATVLAGGTDLVPRINYYALSPEALMHIGGLGLDYIKEEGPKVIVGATTTWSQIADSTILLEKMGILTGAAKQGACVAVRNAGTIGGNLMNASPAGDLTAALLALDAELLLKSSDAERMVPIKDFFTGPGETVRKANELLVEIHIPVPAGQTSFFKLGRRKALTLSVANASVHLVMDGKQCKDARICLGAMAPTPLRCLKAEAFIQGKDVDGNVISDCAAEAVAESNPIDDQRATAWYRQKAAKALVARALAQAAGVQY
jgi:CO/xanthine dehydrogenase FAD-binding subunit